MKPLKILLGNNTLSLLAGSETWTQTLALELKSKGHDVHCYSSELGAISDNLENAGIRCFKEIEVGGIKKFSFVLEEKVSHDYDVIIANHFHVVDRLRNLFPKTPIISTIHGIIHEMDGGFWAPEHPALHSGVQQFISVSEEVRDKNWLDYNLASLVVRNFIDIKRFKDLRPVSIGKPKQFLINSNYTHKDDPATLVIKEVASHFGAKLGAIGMNFVQTDDVTKPIGDADVVFGMGRSVLEGVAAGRLGIVHGRWGTGGPIVESKLEELRYCNFSGRNSKDHLATKEELIKMIEEFYHPTHLDWGKKYIAENHNSVLIADEYVSIARGLIEKPGQVLVDDRKPFRLAKDVN